MGYEIKSPTKQIWLPLDYQFIHDEDNQNFKEFAQVYKEKYGIDLHELFELSHVENDYFVKLKNPLIGAYSVGKFGGDYPNEIALTNAVNAVNPRGFPSNDPLLNICVSTLDANTGHGFILKMGETAPQTIDDLIVKPFEI